MPPFAKANDFFSGPQYNLWTGEMISWLISELRWEMKSCPPALSTIYHGFSTRYQRDIEFEEAYRMLQQLKLDERIAFNWDTRKWYVPGEEAGRVLSD